ncbi:endonuclease VII domain-containing protein [Streptomyces rishiriensis]|uniref:endonuclease VII domain-containing protein n=1 Tax=Streptomyces rishiriensis TaxID=68264 RepID=UPI0035A22940
MYSRRTPRTSCAHLSRKAGNSPKCSIRVPASGARRADGLSPPAHSRLTGASSTGSRIVAADAERRPTGVDEKLRAWAVMRPSPEGTACRAVAGREGHLKRQYGMTEAERDAMVASRKALCVICLKAPAVHVDHCHETGRVRGVLCFNCNSAIGKLGDDPDAVRRAAAYLEGTSWKPTLVAPGVYQLPS